MPNGAASNNDLYEAIGQLKADVRALHDGMNRIDHHVTELTEWKNKGKGGLIVIASLITGLGILGGLIFGILEALR